MPASGRIRGGRHVSARVSIAFAQPALKVHPTWTELDPERLVASYTIERGRQYELDRVDTGRASVSVNDREGLLDPSNPDKLGAIEPLLQVRLQRHNPVLDTWETRFRGFAEEWNYDWDPSQQVNRLDLNLVDIFEIVSVIEMFPGHFGDPPDDDSEGQIQFDAAGDEDDHYGMRTRIYQVLGDAQIPIGPDPGDPWFVVFSGNIAIQKTIYSPGESAMTVIQEAAEAEFPSVGNVFGDRLGRLVVHGRYARFDPEATAANIGVLRPEIWDFHDWKAGDGAAVADSPEDTAHIRAFATNRGLSRIYNRALATPMHIADNKVNAQVVQDATSIGKYGIRPWSSQNLLTDYGTTNGNTALEETKTFARYYVDNYKDPKDRVSSIGFRSSHPDAVGSAANWDLLSRCDIGDRVTITIAAPGGGGIVGDSEDKTTQHIIEGIHEECGPLQPDFDNVTLTLDLSPFAYSEENPYADHPDPGPIPDDAPPDIAPLTPWTLLGASQVTGGSVAPGDFTVSMIRNTPAGCDVFVWCGTSDSGETVASVTDSRGNTYALVPSCHATSGGDKIGELYLYRSRLTHHLWAGDTLTVHYGGTAPGAPRHLVIPFAIDGLDALPNDRVAVQNLVTTGTGSPFEIGPTATTSQPEELLLACVQTSTFTEDTEPVAIPPPVPALDGISIPFANVYTDPAEFTPPPHRVTAWYALVSEADAYTFVTTQTGFFEPWNGILATFKVA